MVFPLTVAASEPQVGFGITIFSGGKLTSAQPSVILGMLTAPSSYVIPPTAQRLGAVSCAEELLLKNAVSGQSELTRMPPPVRVVFALPWYLTALQLCGANPT